MKLVCPITNTDRKNPLRVRIDGYTSGYIMCDQIRSVDIRAREYNIIDSVDDNILWDVCDIIQGSVELE